MPAQTKSGCDKQTVLCIIVNSIIDRPGNIGLRTGRILAYLSQQGKTGFCICRGTHTHFFGFGIYSMGWAGHISRLLNGLRIYLFKRFDNRFYDIHLFDLFSLGTLIWLSLRGHKIGKVFLWEYTPLTLRYLKKRNIPVILDVPILPLTYVQKLKAKHDLPYMQVSERVLGLEQNAYQMSDQIIVPSPLVREEIAETVGKDKRIHCVPFGVTLPSDEQGMRLQRRHHRRTVGIKFCMVGAVNPRKGANILIDVWRDDRFSQDELHLCGRVFPQLQNQINQISKMNIVCPGFVDVFNYLKDCDVFVLPSWSEGSAKAVYEAMAIGLPVIVTAATGSIIKDNVHGFIIEAGNHQQLKAKMEYLKENPDIRQLMGDAAARLVGEMTWEKYAATATEIMSNAHREDA